MKIGILQTAYKPAKDYGRFYNVQELGLARALAGTGHDITLYKAVDGEGSIWEECGGKLKVKLISVKYFGINGLLPVKELDTKLDVLIYFCDTQIIVPSVSKWCQKNDVKLIPYVGVVESHSENIIKRTIMNILSARNLRVFRRSRVLAKTPAMKSELEKIGCRDVVLFPVGLDESIMSAPVDVDNAHRCEDSILYIGRMEEEKHPREMVELYDSLLDINGELPLVMIGDGYLYEETQKCLDEVIRKHGLKENQTRLIKKVQYKDMAQYYSNSSIYINLNRVEILGMSILEAMYYGCTVVAIDAPGPRFIIGEVGDNVRGFVCSDTNDLLKKARAILEKKTDISSITVEANRRVREEFLWTSLAGRLVELL